MHGAKVALLFTTSTKFRSQTEILKALIVSLTCFANIFEMLKELTRMHPNQSPHTLETVGFENVFLRGIEVAILM